MGRIFEPAFDTIKDFADLIDFAFSAKLCGSPCNSVFLLFLNCL